MNVSTETPTGIVEAYFERRRPFLGVLSIAVLLVGCGSDVDWHGGSVSVDDPAMGGARFEVRIPVT